MGYGNRSWSRRVPLIALCTFTGCIPGPTAPASPAIQALTLSQTNVTAPTGTVVTVTGIVTLSRAPGQPVLVTLSSSHPAVTVPSTVTVLTGTNSVTFSIAVNVTAAFQATVT